MSLAIIINGLVVGCIYSLIALGFSMIFKASGLTNFAHGESVTIGALLGFTVLKVTGLPFGLSLVLVFILSGLLGILIEKLAYRPIRVKNAPEINGVISSVGMILILANGAMLVWGAEPLAYPASIGGSLFQILGMTVSSYSLWILAITALLMVVLQVFLNRTMLGKSMRAVADSMLLARLTGIKVDRIISLTFGLGAAFGGVAGVLFAPIYYASFDIGVIGLKSFAAAILGGYGNMAGAVTGGLLLGVVEAVGSTTISSVYKDAIAYGILIMILLLKPSGLFGHEVGRRA